MLHSQWVQGDQFLKNKTTKLVAIVEDLFNLKGRGLIAMAAVHDFGLVGKLGITYKYVNLELPDGTIRKSCNFYVETVSPIDTPSPRRLDIIGLNLPELKKEEVPVGTRITVEVYEDD